MKKNDVRVLVRKIFNDDELHCDEVHLSRIWGNCSKYNLDLENLENILIFMTIRCLYQ